MGSVARLVTSADTDDVADGRSMSISAWHEAELTDGRRVLLLDDRGWSISGSTDIWRCTTAVEVADTARTVVGPDEPPPGLSSTAMADAHWAEMARRLHQAGVAIDASELRRLPHDVVMSDRLLRRLNHGPSPGARP